jgi:hypothetical protein
MLSYFFGTKPTTVNLRELKDSALFLDALIKNDSKSKYIIYNGPDSDSYKTITTWCDITKDLYKVSDNGNGYKLVSLLVTHSGILYDPSTKSFVGLSDEFYDNGIYPNMSAFYPKEFSDLINPDFDGAVFLESMFPKELLEKLKEIQAIGKRFDIDPKHLQDGWGKP